MIIIKKIKILLFITFFGVMIAVLPFSSVYGHGSKGHGKSAFTNYDAIKKSMVLFDKLLEKKKLDHSWELNLSNIKITRTSGEKKQKVIVKISRHDGTPKALYIFFDEIGTYKGSNFKGE